jgi:hypothetical protein
MSAPSPTAKGYQLSINIYSISYLSCAFLSLLGSFILAFNYIGKPSTKTKLLQIMCIIINFSIQIAPIISCISFLIDSNSRVGMIAGIYFVTLANACLFCINLLNNHIFSVFASIFDILNEKHFKWNEFFLLGYGSLLMIALLVYYSSLIAIDGYRNDILGPIVLYMPLLWAFYAAVYDNIKTITLVYWVRQRIVAMNEGFNQKMKQKYKKVIIVTLMTCGLSWGGFICYGLATISLDFYLIAFPGVMMGNYILFFISARIPFVSFIDLSPGFIRNSDGKERVRSNRIAFFGYKSYNLMKYNHIF